MSEDQRWLPSPVQDWSSLPVDPLAATPEPSLDHRSPARLVVAALDHLS
jgi:hypothetical protein